MDTAGDDGLRLQLRVANNDGPAIPLEEWMSFITAELTRQQAVMQQLSIQLAELSHEVPVLRSALTESRLSAQTLRSASVELRQRMDDLDRRLNKVLALIEENFGGGQTEQAMQHHDYVDEYVALVEQKVVGLALEILPDGTQATAREKAEFVAEVCAGLFGAPQVIDEQLIGLLPVAAAEEAIQRMREICACARALRAKVTQGRPQRWEFGYEPAPVDSQWQEPWTGAARDGVVEFVVTPAYFVDTNTLLHKQKVFTSEAGSAPDADPAED